MLNNLGRGPWYKASDFTGGGVGETVEVDGVLRGWRRWRVLGKVVKVDGVLRGRRRRRALGEAVEVDGVLRAGGGDVLRAKRSRSRVKRSSDVEGALRRRRRALGVGGIEDLKRASGKNLLSVERATHPDIYIGARCTTHVH
jgi:hypothetical protein